MAIEKVSYLDNMKQFADKFNLSVDEITRLAEVFEGITPASIGAASTEELTALSNSVTEITGTLATKQELTELAESIDLVIADMTDGTAVKETTLNAGTNTVASYIKSPVNVKRIDGKTEQNLIPPFTSSAWKVNANAKVIDPTTLEVKPTATHQQTRIERLPGWIAGETYTFAHDITGPDALVYFNVQFMDSADVTIGYANTATPKDKSLTFTIPANTARVAVFVTSETSSGTYTISNLRMKKGTQAGTFVSNIKGLTNPTIVNETNGTSLVIPTTLHSGEYVEQNANKELIKYKKFGTLILDNKLDYKYRVKNADGATVIEVITDLAHIKKDVSLSELKDHILVKYDGTTLHHGTVTKSDNFNNVDTILAISIPSRDSGWGANYTPTRTEITAFLLGWKMYDKNTNPNGTGVYDGSGDANKAWVGHAGWNGTDYTGILGLGTFSVPTSKHPHSTPYRLEYELATPVQEVIEPYGDLTLEEGDNAVKVYAGRIVKEQALFGSDEVAVYTNETVYGKLFKYKIGQLFGFYENGSSFTKYAAYKDGFSNGNMTITIRKYNFDALAMYTVDYEPLYAWEVTAPITSVQLEHFETLQSVANEVLEELKSLGARANRASQLIDYLVNHTNQINPHAETSNYTIYVGPTKQFKTVQSAVDSIKKNMGGRSIFIQVEAGYYPEVVRINGFINGYLTVNSVDNNRSSVTLDHIRISYCTATIVISNLTVNVPANMDGVGVVNSNYGRLSKLAITTNSVGKFSGVTVSNANALMEECSISNFANAIHSEVGSTAYVYNGTGSNNTVGLACYGGAVIAKSGTVPGHTTTAESAWAGGVIR